jgi:hypothetical protein
LQGASGKEEGKCNQQLATRFFSMIGDFIQVGVVQALHRFPVKSMRGESLDAARIYWHGFDGDRRFAFVRGDVQSSFTWLTDWYGLRIPA